MARDAWMPLQLLVALSGCIQGLLASPTPPEYDALQRVLQPARHPEARPQQQHKLNGRFLHITGSSSPAAPPANRHMEANIRRRRFASR